MSYLQFIIIHSVAYLNKDVNVSVSWHGGYFAGYDPE